MKFKFTPEVQKIIDAIAKLPDEAYKNEALWEPMRLIGDLEKYLIGKTDKDGKKIPSKEWAKLRRQLSFLYGLVKIATDAEAVGRVATQTLSKMTNMKVFQMPPPEDVNEIAKIGVYRFLVKLVKDVHSGKALEDKLRVRMALNYGVLQLSDHEIDGLIERNKA